MRRLLVPIIAIFVATCLLVSGCTQGSPASSPTQAPAPPKSGGPTKAAAQPTAAPSKKVDFPTKGKSITMIVPWPAGGSSDTGARLLASVMEKELGVPIQVINKPGAGSQVGMSEFVQAKPDGYTLGCASVVPVMTTYLDPERKAAFGRKDLQPLAIYSIEPGDIAVAADGPYKSFKDLLDAAKANPEKVKGGTPGIMSLGHLIILEIQRVTGVKFAHVAFEGGPQSVTATIGGHIDFAAGNVGIHMAQALAGKLHVLAVLDKERSPFLPDAKTAEEQGYKIYLSGPEALFLPAGTPREIVDVLNSTVKKVSEGQDFKKKMTEMGRQVNYLGPDQFDKWITDAESQLKVLIEQGKQSGK